MIQKHAEMRVFCCTNGLAVKLIFLSFSQYYFIAQKCIR